MASFLASFWPTTTSSNDAIAASDQTTIDTAENKRTPKASPYTPTLNVPAFELSNAPEDEAASRTESTPSLQHDSNTASTMTAPSQATKALQAPAQSPGNAARSAPAGLMAPPRAPQSLRPSNGPLPNRGPPGNSQQRAGSNARGKVLLSPGHSPMDWASLTKANNLSGVPTFQRVTPSQLKAMNGRKGKPIWSSYQGKVYNITPYLPFHPGGEKELMKSAGRDGTKLFMDIHPWVNWEGMLSACLVGILVSEEVQGTLEDID